MLEEVVMLGPSHNQYLPAFPPISIGCVRAHDIHGCPLFRCGQGVTQACVQMPTTGLKRFVLGV